MAILINYQVQGTVGQPFPGDSTFSNLAGTVPTVVAAGDNQAGWQYPTAQSLVAATLSSTTGRVVVDVVVQFSAAPTNASEIIQIRGSASICKLVASAAGQLVLQNSAGASTVITSAPVGSKFRIRLDSNGTALSATVYSNDDDTTVAGSATATNAAANAITSVRLGSSSASGYGSGVSLVASWPQVATDPADIGPRAYVAATPPTANAGPDVTVATGGSGQLVGSGGGSNLAYAWSLVSAEGSASATVSGANTSTLTVNPTAGGVLTYRLTVTDTVSNLSTSDTALVYATAASVRPMSVTSAGTWTTTGAANAAAALADADAATYAQSPSSGAEALLRVRLAPLAAGTAFSMEVDQQLMGSGSGTGLVRLYEGATVRKMWSITATGTASTVTLTLTAAELTAFTSLNALDVEMSWTPAT